MNLSAAIEELTHKAREMRLPDLRRFISDLVWGGRDFMQLFTAGYGYPNGDLARIYKDRDMKAKARELERTMHLEAERRVALESRQPRVGGLTQDELGWAHARQATAVLLTTSCQDRSVLLTASCQEGLGRLRR